MQKIEATDREAPPKEDVEALLEFAESLHESYAKAYSQFRVLFLSSYLGICLSAYSVWLTIRDKLHDTFRFWQIPLVLTVTFISLFAAYWSWGMRKRAQTERRAFFEVSVLLHEVYSEAAAKHSWSVLQEALVRARLARLEVGVRRGSEFG